MSLSKSNLLILCKVYPADFNPTVRVEVVHEPAIIYTEIPRRFTGAANWIKFSNLKCWECDLLPRGYPKFVPLYPEKDKNGEDICDAHGHFCEWNCAARYIAHEYAPEQRPDILAALCLFESKFTGRKRKKIMPCPPKTDMKAYCGHSGVTSAQWLAKVEQLNTDYALSSFKIEQLRE